MKNGVHLKSEKLYQKLKNAIVGGSYKHAAQLPTETKLAEKFQVSRDTVRAALKKLEAEGLLIRVRPKGTFVNLPNPRRRLIVALVQWGSDIAEPRNYILPGIQQAAVEQGFELELCPTDFVSEIMPLHQDEEIAGFVIFGGLYSGNEAYIRYLRQTKRPVVMAACHPGDVRKIGFAGLRPDRRQAWIDGLLALKAARHTRIATLTLESLQGFNVDYHGYTEFLSKEGLCADRNLIITAEYNYESIKATLKQLMEMGNPPTAVMCYSDFFGMLLMRAAEELFYKIPQDFSVMGFSGYPGAGLLNPPLATVDLNYLKIGRKVVDVIANASEWFNTDEPVAVPDIVIPHEVILRESALIKRVESVFV